MEPDPAGSQGDRLAPSVRPSTLVLGVGNILLRDEGVGVHVIEAVQRMKVPDTVELLDGGTASMSLMDSLGGRDRVIVVDAVKGSSGPGTIYRFTPRELNMQKRLTSLHQIGLLETLTMLEILGDAPRSIIIYGIEPKEMECGLELSQEVAATIPRVIELVFNELGIPAPCSS